MVLLQMLGLPSLSYSSKISDRFFCVAGIFEGLCYPVLAKFSSHFSLCPAYCRQLRKGQHLAQMASYCCKEKELHLEVSQCPLFSLK